MTTEISPLAPEAFPELPPLGGCRLATGACGIKYENRTDLCVIEFAPGTAVAGVLTRSQTASAPVEWCREVLKTGKARAIIINSGNANAFTGIKGERSVSRTLEVLAENLGCKVEDLLVASTGVIGEPLPEERITERLPEILTTLAGAGWQLAAEAMMTTDTFAKGATREAHIGTARVTINGIAKGSGMIAPDMATMLSFVVTDAKIPASLLRVMLREGADRSFNSITVDSDTSTSDTLVLAATGKASHQEITEKTSLDDPLLADFRRALDEVLLNLAHQVVRDGEGAQKFIEIEVSGAASNEAARKIGLSIANSPLVKTAIAGEDANWGRIVMAVGKAGEKADRDKLSIRMGGVKVAEAGERAEGYDEAPVAAHMKGQEISIQVDVGVGAGTAKVWTCDLTHGYISINADYRS